MNSVVKQVSWDTSLLTSLPKNSTAGIEPMGRKRGDESYLFTPTPSPVSFYPTSKTPALFSNSNQQKEYGSIQLGCAVSGWPWKKLGSTLLPLYRLNPATWTAWGREVRQWRTVELRPPWTGQAEMPLEIPSVSPVNLIFNTKAFLCGRTLAETWSKLISRRKVHSWNWNWDLSLPSGGPWSSWQVTTLSFVGGQHGRWYLP